MKRKEIINKVLGSALLSLLLEVNSYPKPLSVDRIKGIKNLKLENFLATISFISYPFYLSIIDGINEKFKIGKRIYEATILMLKNQKGGNTSLGSIILLIPMITSSAYFLKKEKIEENKLEKLREKIGYVLDKSSYKDSIYICKSILLVKPKWLVKVEKYDIQKENWIEEIKENKAKPKEIMEVAKEFDWIAYEYVTNYEITFKETYPYFKKIFEKTNDINFSTVKTFLWILSKKIDSHIYRIEGEEIAKKIRKEINRYYEKINKKNIFQICNKINKRFKDINAGTTADLVSSCLFLSFLLGIRP